MTPDDPRPARTGRIVIAAVGFELLMLIAAAAWWPVYESAAFVQMAIITVTVSAGFGAVAAARRWPGWSVLAAGTVFWLALGVPLAVPSKALSGVLPTASGLADLVVTTAAGWRQLLTIELPVGSYQALLVPVFALLLVASLVGISVATRTTVPALALLLPAAVLMAGIVFGGSEGFAPVLVGGAFALVAIAWVSIVSFPVASVPVASVSVDPASDASVSGASVSGASVSDASVSDASVSGASVAVMPVPKTRRVAGLSWAAAIGAVVVVVLGAGVAVAALPAAHRAVARDAVSPPFDPGDRPSPLSGFRAYLKPPLADAVMLSVSGVQPGSRLVLARMNHYDGVVFDLAGAPATGLSDGGALFSRVPERLSGDTSGPGDTSAARSITGADLSVAIEIGAYSDVWVPTTATPLSVRFAEPNAERLQNSLYYSAALETAADTAGLGEGDRYRLTTSTSSTATATATGTVPDLAALTPGSPTAGSVVPPTTTTPALDAVAARATEWAPEERTAGDRLAGVVAGLRSGYLSDGLEGETPSRSGHGADRIEELLTASPMVGDDEQYAAAGALLAEAIGFPSRVALGFVVPGPGLAAGEAASGSFAVHGRDVAAWLEVYTAQEGWLPIDVTPGPRPVPETAADDTTTAVQPPDIVPPAPDELDDALDGTASQNDDEVPAPNDPLAGVLQVALVAGLSLAAVAVLLAPFIAVVVAKARRRRRRRRTGSPRSRAAGGWAELTDAARDVSKPPGATATRRETAGALGSPGAVLLAERVDGALFAPAEPDEREIDAIWAAVDAERRLLLSQRGWWARLRARVSLRSLRTYHGSDRKKRDIQ